MIPHEYQAKIDLQRRLYCINGTISDENILLARFGIVGFEDVADRTLNQLSCSHWMLGQSTECGFCNK